MKTRKITESQLREMIKESLEESIVEIQLDEQIAALKARGSRRTLQESKRYHKLLEAKLQMMNEGDQLSLPGMGSATAEEGAVLSGEKQPIKVDDVVKLLKTRITKLYALEDKLKSGQSFALKISSPLGKKAGGALAKSTLLQGIIDKAETAQEVVDMVMALLEDLIDSQYEPEGQK